ncbi:paeninodin family lasso peptide [Virgibacillus necropolis]|nr:paeninodin family lasso peptide [Virgibacillus necropolis]
MKGKWSKPVLEVLDVRKTMTGDWEDWFDWFEDWLDDNYGHGGVGDS